MIHTKILDAIKDPTGWAAALTFLSAALSQNVPPEWAQWCWIAAAVCGFLGVLLRGGRSDAS